ncbi:MAG: hypothetical protein K2J49_07950 [Muribaculaceae bacterium]|nr:hypothetical protein [Muribaculaceae bacterium]
MRKEEQLIEKYGRDSGYRVPEGYFEALNSKIMADLPPYPEAEETVPMSLWQRIKPYAYLAAMFAGIWAMMNVFHRISSPETLNLDNPPAAIASAMELETDDYVRYISVENDYALERAVSESYSSIDEFEADFGYNLKPEFETLEIPVATLSEKPV